MNNAGKRWTGDQEKLLLALIKTNKISEVAKELNRTETALRSRLEKIALEFHKNGMEATEICNETLLSIDVIEQLIYIDNLPNYNAEWDSSQDEWLKKYIKKCGVNECATKMGRADSEIERRLISLAIDDVINDVPIEKVCSKLCLSIENIQNKIDSMKDFLSLEKIDELADEPPYYVVLNGRCKGIYTNDEGAKVSTIGVADAKYKKCNTIEEVRKYMGCYVSSTASSAHIPLPTDITLSVEQQKVIEAVFEGNNVLLLGSAGVGKSFIIKHITRICKERDINIGITSSTGCSAVLIDGKTIHSFLGIGLAKDPPVSLARNVLFKNKKKATSLKELDILLIDEISMLGADLLTTISKYLSILRNCEKPFGGVQVIFSGDFHQLMPVNGSYSFKSAIWDDLNLSCHILTKIYRQEGDIVFQGILERSKNSTITDDDIKILENCIGKTFKSSVKPTSLYPINSCVDKINNEEYSLLTGEEMTYNTMYSSKDTKIYCDKCNILPVLKLKLNTQVMVTRNINPSQQLANGTRGVVVKMYPESVVIQTMYGERVISKFECVSENDKNIKYAIMPLVYAWSITIHKSQGVTLDCATIDIGKSLFAYGQAYTALSRVKSLDGLCIVNVSKEAFKTHPDVIDFYNRIKK